MKLLKEELQLYDHIKQFIKDNEELINQNKFEELYNMLRERGLDVLTRQFTEVLLGIDINPLDYLDYVPNYFLCDSDVTVVNIPNNIRRIGVYAFQNCKNLTNLDLPKGVTSIDNYAFSGCDRLTSISIPNSVERIGFLAFLKCPHLTIDYDGTKEQ